MGSHKCVRLTQWYSQLPWQSLALGRACCRSAPGPPPPPNCPPKWRRNQTANDAGGDFAVDDGRRPNMNTLTYYIRICHITWDSVKTETWICCWFWDCCWLDGWTVVTSIWWEELADPPLPTPVGLLIEAGADEGAAGTESKHKFLLCSQFALDKFSTYYNFVWRFWVLSCGVFPFGIWRWNLCRSHFGFLMTEVSLLNLIFYNNKIC